LLTSLLPPPSSSLGSYSSQDTAEMKEMSQLSPSTKLLTLINVAQARPTKRARSTGRDWYALAKKANRTEPSAAALDELNGAESAGFAAMEDPEDLDEGSFCLFLSERTEAHAMRGQDLRRRTRTRGIGRETRRCWRYQARRMVRTCSGGGRRRMSLGWASCRSLGLTEELQMR
jgi:hypothetical protein